MAGGDIEAGIRSWVAADWDSLRAAWDGLSLVPDRGPAFGPETLTRSQAGLLFERVIMEAFRLDGIAGHHAFAIAGREQIDGILISGWQGFLVEAKYREKAVGIDPVYRLHVLVEHRPVGTLGLFFSASGYTKGAVRSVERLRPIRVLLFHGLDLQWAFHSPGRMMAMVRRKWALALKSGRPHLPVARIGEGEMPVVIPLEYFGEEWSHDDALDPIAHGEPPGTALSPGDLP